MTIDDLKALVEYQDQFDPYDPLRSAAVELMPEILALVEAANMIRAAQGQYIDTDGHPGGYKLLAALDAFNAKLGSL